MAEDISGQRDSHQFLDCGHTGSFLTEDEVCNLTYQFFVNGSIPPGLGAHGSIYNIRSSGENNLFFGSELDSDIELLSQNNPLPLYHYGPPLYKIGLTTDYQDLVIDNVDGDKRKAIWQKIINACKSMTIDESSIIYRARRGDDLPDSLESEFDSSPYPTEGRFNQSNEHIFYGAFDVETCLHEIRVTLTDWIALATFRPKKPLHLLDLTHIIESPNTPYESINIFIDKIIYSGNSEYLLCQELAQEIKGLGYDGFISSSFFKQAHKKDLKNITLFDRPAKDGKIEMIATNKINLNYIAYEFSYGPMRDNKKIDMDALVELSNKFKEKMTLLESGAIEFDEFTSFMDYYNQELLNLKNRE